MKISIVIPLYNKAAYIKRALDSVLAQTERDFEVIVVDDGSTDGGGNLVKSSPDSRVKYFHQQNGGESAARNAGIRLAQSDMVSFLDADDEYKPEFLKTILHLKEKLPKAGVYATAYVLKSRDGSEKAVEYTALPQFPWEGIIPDYFESSCGINPLCSSTVAMRKDVFESAGYFPAGEALGGDVDMWFRLAFNYEVAFSSYIGAVYHRDVDNSALDAGAFRSEIVCRDSALLRTIENALSNNPLSEHKRAAIRKRRNIELLTYATRCVALGEHRAAKKYLFRMDEPGVKRVCWTLLACLPEPITRAVLFVKSKLAG